jgi:hypothetical protein
LADGIITEAELSELKDRYRGCLEGLGLTGIVIGDHGELEVRPPQSPGDSDETVEARGRELVQICAVETSWPSVSSLYNSMRTNPDNLDTAVIMAECLVRVGIMAPGYTGDQYISDLESGALLVYIQGDTPEAEKFKACNFDPTHAQ